MIEETLSPTWDELLVFGKVVVHGRREDIKRAPPLVTIEIYDHDKVSSCSPAPVTTSLLQFNKAEFIGRTTATATVHLDEDMVLCRYLLQDRYVKYIYDVLARSISVPIIVRCHFAPGARNNIVIPAIRGHAAAGLLPASESPVVPRHAGRGGCRWVARLSEAAPCCLTVPAPGELLAAFEMFELVAAGGGGGGPGRLPELPNVKEESVGRADTGPVLPLPPAIRPKLVKYRSELLRAALC